MPHELRIWYSARLTRKRQIDPARGCWLWTGNVGAQGYGRLTRSRRQPGGPQHVLVHRAAAFAWGLIDTLDAPVIVARQKDCPKTCFNPRHLTVRRDRAEAARRQLNRARGERNPHAKLTTEQVLAILPLIVEGKLTDEEIARLVNQAAGKTVCSRCMVEDIRLRKTWCFLWNDLPPTSRPVTSPD